MEEFIVIGKSISKDYPAQSPGRVVRIRLRAWDKEDAVAEATDVLHSENQQWAHPPTVSAVPSDVPRGTQMGLW